MKNGNNRNKNIAIVSIIGAVFLILTISIWVMPSKVHAYEGEGETYISTDEAESAREEEVQEIGESTDDSKTDASFGNQMNKMKDEAKKLMAGIDPGKFNNSEVPAGVRSFGNTIIKYQVTICNSLFYLIMSFSGLFILHGVFAICSDTYFQFFSKFKYSFLSKNVFKIKAEDGVVPEAGNRNNGNNGMPNGLNTQYNASGYNRNQMNQNMNMNNGMNNQQQQGGGMNMAKEKLSVPIQILKFLGMEAILIIALIITLTAIKTGVLINLMASGSVWIFEAFNKIGAGVGSL